MTQERSPVDAPPSASPRHGAQLERDAVEIGHQSAGSNQCIPFGDVQSFATLTTQM
jgi:hypothetical protein